ncbi:MAG: energy-coupling factor transporter ATPase [candidate division Zixibacteria bacterium]
MIEIDNIKVSYRGDDSIVTVISSLSFDVEKGQYLAVLGPNGSGKSTLIKALCGMIPLENGYIRISGKMVSPGRFSEDLFGNVAAVFQEPSGQFLMPDVKLEILSVLQNLGLSYEIQMNRLDQIIERFSLHDFLGKSPDFLSGGQMQIVNLACALAVLPNVLLLDEPTTFLDTHYRQILLDHLDSLHDDGLTILHVTQYPDEALRSGRVLVLDSGDLVSDGEPREILGNHSLLTSHNLTMPRRIACKKWLGFDYAENGAIKSFCGNIESRKNAIIEKKSESSASNDPYICAKNIYFEHDSDSFSIDIDHLDLYRGQIVGLVGPTGSGKSTLAFLLAGLLKPENGTIELSGKPLSAYENRILRQRIGISWQMPDPVLIGPTVAEDISFMVKNLETGDIDIETILSRVGLAGLGDRIVDSLSGGEKRKLSFACVLSSEPDYAILDEPPAFLDPSAQEDLITIIKKIADSGAGVLVIGHDIPFISELAERIIGLKDGRIVFDLPSTEFFSDPAYLLKLGLMPDPLVGLRKYLADKEIIVPWGSLNPQRIADYLKLPESR